MRLLLPFIFPLVLFCCNQPEGPKTTTLQEELSIEYDSLLASETGADELGMRSYILAYLKEGPNRDQSLEEAEQLQRAHLDNIKRMAKEGKLILAGPFMDDHEVKGIYLFAVETVEEAEALTNSDPAIQVGRLKMELHPWYGSAALMKLGDIHKKISKKDI